MRHPHLTLPRRAITIVGIALLVCASTLRGQSTPVLNAPPTPPSGPQVVEVSPGVAVDLPPTWSLVSMSTAINLAYQPRVNADAVAVIRRAGTPPADQPYGFVERLRGGVPTATVADRETLADQVAEYYRTALNPPSKAARPPAWRRAKVSPIRFDAGSMRFRFDATLTYDPPMGDVNVSVSGIYAANGQLWILGLWRDADYDATNAGEVPAIRDSFRFIVPPDPVAAAGQSARRTAQVLVGLLLLAVVVLQVIVLLRERRARRGEAVELI